jgi:phosphoribosyl 1,2-cyclic phosphodiesterase
MKFSTLASGSKGNATVVEAEGYRILIDCGLTIRELKRRLLTLDIELSSLHALLITHFHSDHIKGIPQLLKNFADNPDGFEICSSRRFAMLPTKYRWQRLRISKEMELGPFSVMPFELPHDGGGSVGYKFSYNNKNFIFATDLGFPTSELGNLLQDADAVVIESNHDLDMLQQSEYPQFVKDRISSAYGHLSNCQSAELLSSTLSKDCQHVVLGHLSERANTHKIALANMRAAVSSPVSAASQHIPSNWYAVV